MERKYIIAAFLLILLILTLSSPLVSSQTPKKAVNKTVNQNVSVGLYLLNLGKFDISTGSFTADFYLSFKCHNSCPDLEFEFMNGRAASIDKIIDEPNEKFYRIQANLNSPVDLKRFPFDSQKMQIIIEDKKKTSEELIYVPNKEESGIDKSIAFVGWDLGKWEAYEKAHEYEIYNESYSQYVFSIPISRIKINAIFKTFLPITFIILVMLSSYVLDPDKITTRLAMVGSALVASVMFHVSLANQIPPVGYLTFIDKFMVITYFVVLLSFVFNVFLLELLEEKKESLVKKLHGYTEFTMFILVPVLYLLLFLFFL